VFAEAFSIPLAPYKPDGSYTERPHQQNPSAFFVYYNNIVLHECRRYKKSFTSRNKLFQHLKSYVLPKLPPPLIQNCLHCTQSFPSRTKLFKYLKTCPLLEPRLEEQDSSVATANLATDLPERVSTAPPLDIGTGIGYRGYTYTIA